jgi:hypothetical protein
MSASRRCELLHEVVSSTSTHRSRSIAGEIHRLQGLSHWIKCSHEVVPSTLVDCERAGASERSELES